MEIFMDDFSIFNNTFKVCLGNLYKVLATFYNTNLVLNKEKCHFLVREGIVLGHNKSKYRLEVDKSKVEDIEKISSNFSERGS